MRASFEETVDILMDAAAFGVSDEMSGVTQAVMLGQAAPVGTGFFDLFLDDEELQKVLPASKLNPQLLPFDTDFASMGGLESPFVRPGDSASTPYFQATPGFSGGMSPGASPSQWQHMQFAASPLATPGGALSSPRATPLGSPAYFQSAAGFSPASPGFSPASPGFSPASPAYQSSPAYGGGGQTFYSPSSPFNSSPSSPYHGGGGGGAYTPSSPASYTPSSPANFSPSSPRFSPSR